MDWNAAIWGTWLFLALMIVSILYSVFRGARSRRRALMTKAAPGPPPHLARRSTMKSVAVHAVLPVLLLVLLRGFGPSWFGTTIEDWHSLEPWFVQVIVSTNFFVFHFFPLAVLILAGLLALDAYVSFQLRARLEPFDYQVYAFWVWTAELAAVGVTLCAFAYPILTLHAP